MRSYAPGTRTQIDKLFLEQIAVRELRHVDVHAGLRFVIERRLFECIAFDAEINSERQLLRITPAARGIPATRQSSVGVEVVAKRIMVNDRQADLFRIKSIFQPGSLGKTQGA